MMGSDTYAQVTFSLLYNCKGAQHESCWEMPISNNSLQERWIMMIQRSESISLTVYVALFVNAVLPDQQSDGSSPNNIL